MVAAGLLLLSAVLAGIPPLTSEQRTRLETAYDGRDHQEEAFVALLEHVSQWTPGLGTASIRLEPDPQVMLQDPQAHRGALCRLAGTVVQQTALARPYESVTEWFIRDEAGRPILVYVVGLNQDRPFRDGSKILIDARFYKRVDFVARDGARHEYAAFVGRFPSLQRASAADLTRLWVVLVPVVVMLVVFMALFLYVRRHSGRTGHRLRPLAAGRIEVDDDETLPEDPAEALAELRRRAES